MNILFVTWDSTKVTYLQTLFIPIFLCLRESGFNFHIVQFVLGEKDEIHPIKDLCKFYNLKYKSIKVLKKPNGFGQLFTAFAGSFLIRKIIKEWSIDVVMPRSNMPALSCMIALRNLLIPIVFDADGLPLDERLEFSNQSPFSLNYRLLRIVESEMIRRSDVVLTRTYKAINILSARAGACVDNSKFIVVGNGRNNHIFTPKGEISNYLTRVELGIKVNAPIVVYCGSIGSQYCLDEMFFLFEKIYSKSKDAIFLILTNSPELVCLENFKLQYLKRNLIIKKVVFSDIPRYLSCSDLGLSLRRDSFSMQAVSPIKIGEYLLCGLPVVVTKNLIDTDWVGKDTGFMIEQHNSESYDDIASWFIEYVLRNRETIREDCNKVGIQFFSISSTVSNYLDALNRLRIPS